MLAETERDLRIKQLRLIVFVILVIFVVMLVYTIYWLIDYNKHFGFFVKTDAKVIEHADIEGVQYDVLSYKINGIEYKVTSDIKSTNDVGDEITIYYDKDNPLGIIYSLDGRRIALPIIACCFGIVSIALVVVYVLIDRANKLDKLKSSYKTKYIKKKIKK